MTRVWLCLREEGPAGLATSCERSPIILLCFGRAAGAGQNVVDEANRIGTGALGRGVTRGEMLSQAQAAQAERFSVG